MDNAINTVKRELETRYDLRGSNSNVEFDKKALSIKLSTEDHLKLDSILSILLERSTKQKVDDAKSLCRNLSAYQPNAQRERLELSRTVGEGVQQGLVRETGAKEGVKFIKVVVVGGCKGCQGASSFPWRAMAIDAVLHASPKRGTQPPVIDAP
ncbi:MAG: DUF520 family protein [Flavobacteriales bacterium]|nr:DUF520 family protein [Flavobacteriales bacterium]